MSQMCIFLKSIIAWNWFFHRQPPETNCPLLALPLTGPVAGERFKIPIIIHYVPSYSILFHHIPISDTCHGHQRQCLWWKLSCEKFLHMIDCHVEKYGQFQHMRNVELNWYYMLCVVLSGIILTHWDGSTVQLFLPPQSTIFSALETEKKNKFCHKILDKFWTNWKD